MHNHSSDLNQIETRLRAILRTYEQARTKGDFLHAILGVHTALEDAFDYHLDDVSPKL